MIPVLKKLKTMANTSYSVLRTVINVLYTLIYLNLVVTLTEYVIITEFNK